MKMRANVHGRTAARHVGTVEIWEGFDPERRYCVDCGLRVSATDHDCFVKNVACGCVFCLECVGAAPAEDHECPHWPEA